MSTWPDEVMTATEPSGNLPARNSDSQTLSRTATRFNVNDSFSHLLTFFH